MHGPFTRSHFPSHTPQALASLFIPEPVGIASGWPQADRQWPHPPVRHLTPKPQGMKGGSNAEGSCTDDWTELR